MADALDPPEDKAASPGQTKRLYLWVGLVTAAGAALWLAGWLALGAAGQDRHAWDAVWALTGVSFLFAFLPLPGVTSALLLALRKDWVLGTLGVLGAAIGGTVAAGLLLALGETGRIHLRKRATHSKRARKTLEWSRKAAKKWTYAGVLVLLIPQFIPRAVVLYAAVLAHLRAVPFLAAVLVGTFLRNLVMLAGFSFIP
jgi:uncharacterized membrane protein YdjX (TVP38/TMEM64 family)